MSRFGNWTKPYKKQSRRSKMGRRFKGGRSSIALWQRTKRRDYESATAMGTSLNVSAGEIYDAMEWLMDWADGEAADIVGGVEVAARNMAENLENTTPKDPKGPNDPPLHAKDSWRVVVDQQGRGKVHISVSNPKDYMQFLEAYGGVHDSSGNRGGPEPGWIAEIFANFALDLREV